MRGIPEALASGPVPRAVAASKGKRYRLLTPRIGEPVMLDDPHQTFTHWWKGLE